MSLSLHPITIAGMTHEPAQQRIQDVTPFVILLAGYVVSRKTPLSFRMDLVTVGSGQNEDAAVIVKFCTGGPFHSRKLSCLMEIAAFGSLKVFFPRGDRNVSRR